MNLRSVTTMQCQRRFPQSSVLMDKRHDPHAVGLSLALYTAPHSAASCRGDAARNSATAPTWDPAVSCEATRPGLCAPSAVAQAAFELWPCPAGGGRWPLCANEKLRNRQQRAVLIRICRHVLTGPAASSQRRRHPTPAEAHPRPFAARVPQPEAPALPTPARLPLL